jgi:putative hydrolase of the HAD superfamily
MGALIDAVLFDAGGVLVVPDPAAIAPVFRRFGADPRPEDVVRAHYAGMRAQDAQATEYDDWDLYRMHLALACGVPPDDAVPAAVALHEVWSPYLWRHPLAVAVSALFHLQRQGVPLGVVSNASGQIEGVLAAQGVCQVGTGAGVPVQVIVDSEVAGVMKPNPAIFAPALEVLGLAPDRVGYVGDSVRNDVRGAEAAGLVPLHLDPHDDHPDAQHRRIRSLHDLLDLVAP